MAKIPGDLTNLVFGRVEGKNFGELSIDSHMLNILISLDGKKTLGQIASQNGMNRNDMRTALAKLMKYGLVESANRAVQTLDSAFLKFLTFQMSQSVGPIASILIEDAARVLGYGTSAIPVHRAAELVDLLSKEIANEQARNLFTKRMVDRIKGF